MSGIGATAPISPSALEPVPRPFGHATMLPAAAYTSDEVWTWERRHLFAGSWVCLGRYDELRHGEDGRPVTQRGLIAGDVPVLLTFPAGGGVRGAGQHLPGFDQVAGFEPEQLGLVRLPVTVWQGWVFVNATGDGHRSPTTSVRWTGWSLRIGPRNLSHAPGASTRRGKLEGDRRELPRVLPLSADPP